MLTFVSSTQYLAVPSLKYSSDGTVFHGRHVFLPRAHYLRLALPAGTFERDRMELSLEPVAATETGHGYDASLSIQLGGDGGPSASFRIAGRELRRESVTDGAEQLFAAILSRLSLQDGTVIVSKRSLRVNVDEHGVAVLPMLPEAELEMFDVRLSIASDTRVDARSIPPILGSDVHEELHFDAVGSTFAHSGYQNLMSLRESWSAALDS